MSASRNYKKFNYSTSHHITSQSLGKVAIDVQAQGIDLLTIVGHKYGAPKGIAALFVREGIRYVIPTIFVLVWLLLFCTVPHMSIAIKAEKEEEEVNEE